jgi:phospholipid/cholesterol/gamma-HCH transport system permease protein
MVTVIKHFIIRVGKRALGIWGGYKEFKRFVKSIILSFRSLKHLRIRSIYTIIINQTKFTGVDAIPLVGATAILLGATVIIQSMQKFPKFGIDSFIGDLLVLIIAREIGPLATAMIVVSRSGSAIAAEIATQKQNMEIRSLELLGIDTKLYIVFPRIIAAILSIFSLIIIFDIVAFFGGYLIALTSVYIPFDQFVQSLLDSLSFEDLTITLLKSLIYGILIPLISCYYGFKPNSAIQIPIFVSKAVMRSLLVLFIINALISVVFYL